MILNFARVEDNRFLPIVLVKTRIVRWWTLENFENLENKKYKIENPELLKHKPILLNPKTCLNDYGLFSNKTEFDGGGVLLNL